MLLLATGETAQQSSAHSDNERGQNKPDKWSSKEL
jgi:hypothetical protein